MRKTEEFTSESGPEGLQISFVGSFLTPYLAKDGAVGVLRRDLLNRLQCDIGYALED